MKKQILYDRETSEIYDVEYPEAYDDAIHWALKNADSMEMGPEADLLKSLGIEPQNPFIVAGEFDEFMAEGDYDFIRTYDDASEKDFSGEPRRTARILVKGEKHLTRVLDAEVPERYNTAMLRIALQGMMIDWARENGEKLSFIAGVAVDWREFIESGAWKTERAFAKRPIRIVSMKNATMLLP